MLNHGDTPVPSSWLAFLKLLQWHVLPNHERVIWQEFTL